jgi:GT2 family glycosyltransferase
MTYWGICSHLFGFEYQASELARPDEIPYAATLNFCIRRDRFLALGGFDEDFRTAGGEDRDFGWQLEQAGYSIMNAPTARVLHNHTRQDFPSAWKHAYHYGCAAAQFRLKYAESNNRKWHTYRKIALIPAIGETAGVLRSFFRNLARIITQPGYLKQAKFIPGIFILDIAHSIGTIHTLRSFQ